MFRVFTFNKYHYTDNRGGCPCNFIAYMNEGDSKIVCNDNTIEVHQGECFFIPKGLSYESFWYGKDSISFVSLGFTEMPCEENQTFFLQKINCGSHTKEKIKMLGNEMTISAMALCNFYVILSDLMPLMQNVQKSKEQQLADKIKRYIINNPLNSVPQILDDCYISKSYLYHIFKITGNKSPNDFRYEIICKIAVEMLISTDKKVEHIAEILNFSSASYFRKILKKYTGKTPKEIRGASII